MSFTPEKDVHPKSDRDTKDYQFVGYYENAGRVRFTFLSYGFCNPVSASMFSYLHRHPDVPTVVATDSVVRFEQLLNPSGAMKAMYEMSVANLAFAIPEVGPIIEAGAKALQAGGSIVQGIQTDAKAGIYNPHMPKAGWTWTGKAVNQYVDYAVAYYKKHPLDGPAYKLMSELGSTVHH